MSKFINFLNEQIRLQMSLGKAKDQTLLTGYRNLKSDFEYQISKNSKLDEIELLKKLSKSRKDNMDLYKNIKRDLYVQEKTEFDILEPFIPQAPNEADVIAFLESKWPISRSKMDFPVYQNACLEQFGQKVEPAIIFKFIRNDY